MIIYSRSNEKEILPPTSTSRGDEVAVAQIVDGDDDIKAQDVMFADTAKSNGLGQQAFYPGIHDQYAPPSPTFSSSLEPERGPPPAYSSAVTDDVATGAGPSLTDDPEVGASRARASFSRPVPTFAAFPPVVEPTVNGRSASVLLLHSRTKSLEDGFFCVPPTPIPNANDITPSQQTDHPFSRRDVREVDWVTFLGAVRRAAKPAEVKEKSYCEAVREANERRERKKFGNGDNLVTGDSTSATGRKGWSICADRRGLIFGITMGLPGTFSFFCGVYSCA